MLWCGKVTSRQLRVVLRHMEPALAALAALTGWFASDPHLPPPPQAYGRALKCCKPGVDDALQPKVGAGGSLWYLSCLCNCWLLEGIVSLP